MGIHEGPAGPARVGPGHWTQNGVRLKISGPKVRKKNEIKKRKAKRKKCGERKGMSIIDANVARCVLSHLHMYLSHPHLSFVPLALFYKVKLFSS